MQDPSRRPRLPWLTPGRVLLGGLLLLLLGCFVASLIEPHLPRVYPQTLTLPGLPSAFRGLRVVQLTDIHHGPFLGRARVRHLVDMANAQAPDLIVLTGDYVHRSGSYIAPVYQELSRLHAPGGVYAVLGNHDQWEDEPLVFTREQMRRAGLVDLTNRSVCLQRSGQCLYLAGAADLWTEATVIDTELPDLDRALASVPPHGLVLLLTHNPDLAEQVHDPRVRLILAGHTHGGQVCLPLVGPPLLPSRYGRKYAAGLVVDGSKQIYVSRGVGCITPPVRFRCRPEVTLLTLN